MTHWLYWANAISAALAVISIGLGASTVSPTWLGSVLGWQWAAIAAVCLGSLLLLLALLGTIGARLHNRFSLLSFAVLEALVAAGTLVSAIWCLALAGGSASVSQLMWDAFSEEVRPQLIGALWCLHAASLRTMGGQGAEHPSNQQAMQCIAPFGLTSQGPPHVPCTHVHTPDVC